MDWDAELELDVEQFGLHGDVTKATTMQGRVSLYCSLQKGEEGVMEEEGREGTEGKKERIIYVH